MFKNFVQILNFRTEITNIKNLLEHTSQILSQAGQIWTQWILKFWTQVLRSALDIGFFPFELFQKIKLTKNYTFKNKIFQKLDFSKIRLFWKNRPGWKTGLFQCRFPVRYFEIQSEPDRSGSNQHDSKNHNVSLEFKI